MLLSLQEAMGSELGVLSPNLVSFAWLADLDPWLPPKASGQILPMLSLFVGGNARSFQYRRRSESDIHSVLSTSGRLPNLQHLTFLGCVQDSFGESLTPYPWANLESISSGGHSASVATHLARLPRLSTIRIEYMLDTKLGPATAHSVASDPSSFKALKEVCVHGHKLAYATKVLLLPPSNQIRFTMPIARHPAPLYPENVIPRSAFFNAT